MVYGFCPGSWANFSVQLYIPHVFVATYLQLAFISYLLAPGKFIFVTGNKTSYSVDINM